jgi:hypothetical protein
MVNEVGEFKFPDEQNEKVEVKDTNTSDFKVLVEDDTPPEDRGRVPLPKDIVEELEKDDLEEYSEKVRKRLSQMKKVYHDERRAKEAVIREREEAVRFAQQQFDENKRLKERLGQGQKVYLEEVSKTAANDLELAKSKLKQAYDLADTDQIVAAQELLADAKLRIREYEKFKPSLQDSGFDIQNTQQARGTTQAPPPANLPDQKAVEWQKRNTWFGADEEMTALALGLHEKLVRSGVDPRSDDYYRRVDETIRKRFPEAFDEEAEEKLYPQTSQEQKPARTKPATVVAPVTRSTAPRQVRLSPSQVALAKKLGLSNEQYALELMKLENN